MLAPRVQSMSQPKKNDSSLHEECPNKTQITYYQQTTEMGGDDSQQLLKGNEHVASKPEIKQVRPKG